MCLRLPEGLVPFGLPQYLLVGWWGSCFPLCPFLDGVSVFPRFLSSFVSQCSPPSRGSCLPLLPIVTLLVFFCCMWMACSPSQGSCLQVSPIVLLLASFVGASAFLLASLCWWVRLPKSCSPFVFHGAPFCIPSLDGVSAFSRVLFPCVSDSTASCFL